MDRITSKARLILSLDDSSFLLIDTEGGVGPRSSDTPWPNFPTEQTVALGQHQIWPLPPEKSTRHATASHRRTVTVTATDYEFQRAVLCCLAAGLSHLAPDAVTWAAPPMCQCMCVDAEPSMHQTSLQPRLNVRHHLGQCP
jgi:hypothetical protein